MRRVNATLIVSAPIALLALSLIMPQSAEAFPPFAEKEGKQCIYCHTKPTGGKRNYRGMYYKAHNLTFSEFDDEAEAKKAGVAVGEDPNPETKPKSWTAPAGAAAASNGNGKAEKPMTVAEAKKKAAAAFNSYKGKKNDANLKKAYAASLADLGHAIMLDQSIPPAKRYPQALDYARKALALDPSNKLAKEDKKQIEDAYKSMGKPIPK
ncbi:MAG: hypothetical protein OHK0029_15820 [Armatimonadaceae bacterium]